VVKCNPPEGMSSLT